MTKLERAKRFLNQTSRPGLRVLSLAVLAMSAYAQGTVFNVSGTFEGGDTLAGTINIDTTGSSGILSEDLTVDPVVVYTFTGANDGTGIQSFSNGSSPNFYDNAVFFGNSNSELVLDIFLGGTNSFVGYTGGALCSDGQFCGGAESSFALNVNTQEPGDPPLSSGTLSSATPEPSSALLAIGGGAAVLALRRRKRRA
jgi:hypothetical protein